ncbi:MAG: nitronate monooxygenase [Clostridiales bacterium]|nr:nitronate monooxygenase [Clostridiales bacterium]
MSDSLLKPLKIGDLTAKIPVIQGGMGVGISLSGLAGAVAANGGVGVISTAQIGYASKDFYKDPIGCNLRAIKEEINKARKIAGTNGIIGVNIMVATKKYEEYVRAAVAAGVDIIISGAGLPMTLPGLIGKAKTKIAPIVSSLKSAQIILKYWIKKYDRLPDMVVIEGPLAGGHLGFKTEQLIDMESLHYDEEIRRIIQHVNECGREQCKEIPVVVAGGIYTREDAEHCFSLGASGVQMATRFVTTYECDASSKYKQAYIDAEKEDIVIVKSPVGMPARAISSRFTQKAGEGRIPPARCYNCIITCNPAETPYCITEALINVVKGNIKDALLFCGANAYRAKKLEYVKDIMKEFEIDGETI